MVKDPVCGMDIEPKAAFATRPFRGQMLYFCSEACVQKFDGAPERYVMAVPSATTGIAEGTAGPVRLELPVRGLDRVGGPALARALEAVPGVSKAAVNVRHGRVAVEYDPARVKIADLLDAIRAAGFSSDGQTIRLKVSGLYCAECVARIEDALKATPGVLDATMNAATNEVKVEYSPVLSDKSARLPEGETVPMEFMPDKAGEFEFQCQMGMLRGKLIVEDDGLRPLSRSRWPRWASADDDGGLYRAGHPL